MDKQTRERLKDRRYEREGHQGIALEIGTPCELSDNGSHPVRIRIRGDGALQHISCGCATDHELELIEGAMRMGGESCMEVARCMIQIAKGTINVYDLEGRAGEFPYVDFMKQVGNYRDTVKSRVRNREHDEKQKRTRTKVARFNRMYDRKLRQVVGSDVGSNIVVRRRLVDLDDPEGASVIKIHARAELVAQRNTERVWTIDGKMIKKIAVNGFIKTAQHGDSGHCWICDRSFSAPKGHSKSVRHRENVQDTIRSVVMHLKSDTDAGVQFGEIEGNYY